MVLYKPKWGTRKKRRERKRGAKHRAKNRETIFLFSLFYPEILDLLWFSFSFFFGFWSFWNTQSHNINQSFSLFCSEFKTQRRKPLRRKRSKTSKTHSNYQTVKIPLWGVIQTASIHWHFFLFLFFLFFIFIFIYFYFPLN